MASRSWIFPSPIATDVEGVAALRIEAMSGHLEIAEHDRDHVHVAVDDVAGPSVEMSLDGDRLLISHAPGGFEGFWRRLVPSSATGRIRLRVFVPASVTVDVSASGCETMVRALSEDVSVSTVSGRVTLMECRAAARVRTVSGDVVVREHAGDVAVSTVSGRTDVSGRIPVVDISTGTSGVWCATGELNSRVTVSSMSGAVNIRVPAETTLRLSARRLGGSVAVDGQPVDVSGGRELNFGAFDTVADVTVSIASGTVDVRRDVVAR